MFELRIRGPLLRYLTVLSLTFLPVFSPGIVLWPDPLAAFASPPLPHVSREMEKPRFWTQKIRNPRQVLLTPEEIRSMNEENLRRGDLFLCAVRDLKDEWTRQEILALLEEDWQGFGSGNGLRYGRLGVPLGVSFWNELERNMDQESLKDKNRIRFGLVVKRTNIRVFPTDEPSLETPDSTEFDRFQHSSISPGSLIGIYHLSKDGRWTYVQTRFIRGWIRTEDLAVAKEKMEATDYEGSTDRLVITGNFVDIFTDPSLQQVAFSAQMGTSFPILNLPEKAGTRDPYYSVRIPTREENGQLTFRKGYLSGKKDVHQGFLPYTQENVARQAFKMLHEPYGWGEMFGGRDCSRFIMDIFDTFGIVMPRNSKLQAMIGTSLGNVEEMSLKEKHEILNRATPLATLLRMPGHIMLYLGKHQGRYYVIHSIWGTTMAGPSGPVRKKIGNVVVSDLSLGRSNSCQSFLHRITDIRCIGSNVTVPR